jgi:hypothetical protein
MSRRKLFLMSEVHVSRRKEPAGCGRPVGRKGSGVEEEDVEDSVESRRDPPRREFIAHKTSMTAH